MPSPVKNPAIRYYDNFNLNQSGKPYSHLDFDWEDTLANFCSSDFSGVLSDQSGNTQYWYDRYGRIIASQNPVQKDNELYAYTLYDDQGRPDEVGLVRPDYALTESIAKADDFGLNVKLWVESGLRIEVVKTIYDEYLSVSINNKFENGQQNLRLRVASILYFDNFSIYTDIANEYTTATHYSYDTHGNVIETLQDVPLMKPVEQDIKSTQYKYDLISGNMNKVEYQKGEIDGFTHMYYYDELNRLKEVKTSSDNEVHVSTEAKYQYYDYGPLARVETGEYQVQGIDYAYTINGWLKGANSNTLDPNRDMGKDAAQGYYANNPNAHQHFAKDAFGFTLNYFEDDYVGIGANNFEAAYVGTPFGNASTNLYNGNIRHMVTAIEGFETQGYAYTYDQLQRLTKMEVYRDPNLSSANNWNSSTAKTDYLTQISYDKNGNILTLDRNGYQGAQTAMDNMSYNYNNIAGELSNRLGYVDDGAQDFAGYEDIKQGQSSGNYKYNKLGELTEDASENMELDWRLGDHKLKNIKRTDQDSPNLTFVYNPLGVRVAKIKMPRSGGSNLPQEEWTVTYYTYDANGQLMSTYESELYTPSKRTSLEEQYIYGSKRVGVVKANQIVFEDVAIEVSTAPKKENVLGRKRYELTNHLGNVLATISDRKVYNPNQGYYEPVITMRADYYAFGMLMPDRSSGLDETRHLFNGMEADAEVSGDGNSYTTQFRQYDPRLGRWKSLDPLMAMFPNMSSYVGFANNPIFFTDPYGLAPTNGEGEPEKKGNGHENTEGSNEYNGHQEVEEVKIYPSSKQSAIRKAKELSNADQSKSFPRISPEQLSSDLISLINNPEGTKQLPNTCGISACQYAILQDNPEAFVDFVTDAYSNDRHNQPQVFKENSEDKMSISTWMRRWGTEDENSGSWIFQLTLRNTYNEVMAYDPRRHKNDQLGGITTPNEVKAIMKTFGYSEASPQNMSVNEATIKYRTILLYDTQMGYGTSVMWHYVNALGFYDKDLYGNNIPVQGLFPQYVWKFDTHGSSEVNLQGNTIRVKGIYHFKLD